MTQRIQALEEELLRTTDEQDKTLVELELAWELRRSDRSRSTAIADRILEISKASHFDLGVGRSLLILGVNKVYKAEYQQALSLLEASFDLFKSLNDATGLIRNYNSFGFMYVNMGKYDKALPFLIEGLSLAKQTGDHEMATMILYNLAEIQKDDALKKYDDALYDLLEAESICLAHQVRTLPLIQSSICTLYYRLEDLEKARSYAFLALDSAELAQDYMTRDQSYHMIADTFFFMGDLDMAMDISLRSMDIQKILGNAIGMVNNQLLQAKILIKKGRHSEAKALAELALQKAETYSMNLLTGDLCQLLSDLNEHFGDFEQALFYSKKVIAYSEQKYTTSLEKQISVLSAEMKHDQLQQEAEIHRLKNVELRETSETLARLLNELQEAQEHLIQSEKMAALGNLVAGIAHEINSPFGAMQASIQNIKRYADKTLTTHLPSLLHNLPDPEREAFFDLLALTMNKNVLRSAKEDRQSRREWLQILESMALPNKDWMAEHLVDMGIYEWHNCLDPILHATQSTTMLQVAYELSGILRNIENIHLSIKKTSKIVFALKQYSHFSHSEEPLEADLLEGLQTVLQLHANQFKNNIDLITHFEALPKRYCFPDELVQVWMNLIQNALHAMNNKGTLKILTSHEDKGITIVIEDSGSGIPESIQDKIFEPFFTTKPQGVGSGLGLSIVKKIIGRHGGTISFTSQPGLTRFTVWLPTTQPNLSA